MNKKKNKNLKWILIAVAVLLLGLCIFVAIKGKKPQNDQVAEYEQSDSSVNIGTDLTTSAQTELTELSLRSLETVTEDTIGRIETTKDEYIAQIETVTNDYQDNIQDLKDQFGQDSENYQNALEALHEDYTQQIVYIQESANNDFSDIRSEYERRMNDQMAQGTATEAEIRAKIEEVERAYREAIEALSGTSEDANARLAELIALNAATIQTLEEQNAALSAEIQEMLRRMTSYLSEDCDPYLTKIGKENAQIYGYTITDDGKYKLELQSQVGTLGYDTPVTVVGYTVCELDGRDMGYFRLEYGNGQIGFAKDEDVSKFMIIPEDEYDIIAKANNTLLYSDWFGDNVALTVDEGTALLLTGTVYRDGFDFGLYRVEYNGETYYVNKSSISSYAVKPFYNYGYINKPYIPLYATMNAEAESGLVMAEIPAGTYLRVDGRVYEMGLPTNTYHVTLIGAVKDLTAPGTATGDTDYFALTQVSGYVKIAGITMVTYSTASVENQSAVPQIGKPASIREYYTVTNTSSAAYHHEFDYQLEDKYISNGRLVSSARNVLGSGVYVTVTRRVFFDGIATNIVKIEAMDGSYEGLVDEAQLTPAYELYEIAPAPTGDDTRYIRSGNSIYEKMPLYLRDKDYRLVDETSGYYLEIVKDRTFVILYTITYNGSDTDYAGRTLYFVQSLNDPSVKGYVDASYSTESFKVAYAVNDDLEAYTAYVRAGEPILSAAPYETEDNTTGWVNDINPEGFSDSDTSDRDIDSYKVSMNSTGTNYTLVGWSTSDGDIDLANPISKTDVVTGNTTVYAVYSRSLIVKLCGGDFAGEYSDFTDENVGVFTPSTNYADTLVYKTTQNIAFDHSGSVPVWAGQTKEVVLPGIPNDIANGCYKWASNPTLTVSQVAWKVSAINNNGIIPVHLLTTGMIFKNADTLYFTDHVELHPLYGFNVRYYTDADEYTDMFVCYGDSAIDEQYISQVVPVRNGVSINGADDYSLYGWSLESGELEADTVPTILSDADIRVSSEGIVIYAIWKRPVTVSFEKGSATSWTAPANITKNGYYRMGYCSPLTFDLPTSVNYTYEGWTFNGWRLIGG